MAEQHRLAGIADEDVTGLERKQIGGLRPDVRDGRGSGERGPRVLAALVISDHTSPATKLITKNTDLFTAAPGDRWALAGGPDVPSQVSPDTLVTATGTVRVNL